MTASNQPLVTILTPVYNGEQFLAESIESVLAQSYSNWEYVIVNNCSRDRSLEIANEYAAKDDRIRVHDNPEFLSLDGNLNNALKQISPESEFCKFVFADDLVFPQAVEEMVRVTQENPAVAIVGCYGIQGRRVAWSGLPYPKESFSGKDTFRRFFIDGVYPFGTPSSLLIRSDIIRAEDKFFVENNTHCDTWACLRALTQHEFGFVHQVLVYARERAESQSSKDRKSNTMIAARLLELQKFGPAVLDDAELQMCRRRILDEYYNYLAVMILRRHFDKSFWAYHRRWMDDSGVGLSLPRLVWSVVKRATRALLLPGETLKKLKAG